nr:uncharacterized protein LOC105843700 [Hydra vulgaris]
MFATTTFRLMEKSIFLVVTLGKYMKRGQPVEVVESCIKCSLQWQGVQKFTLTENMRVRDGEGEFSKLLLKLGSGTISVKEEDPFKGCIEIPQQCIIREQVLIVEKLFGDAQQDDYAKRLILTLTNVDSLSINKEVLERLHGEVKTYLSADQIETDGLNERNNFPVEFLNSLTPSEVLTGVSEGKRVFVPRIQLAPSDSNLPFVLKRRHSMTINKSQGQTFDRVACSGTRTFNSLFFKVDKHPVQGMLEKAIQSAEQKRELNIEDLSLKSLNKKFSVFDSTKKRTSNLEFLFQCLITIQPTSVESE